MWVSRLSCFYSIPRNDKMPYLQIEGSVTAEAIAIETLNTVKVSRDIQRTRVMILWIQFYYQHISARKYVYSVVITTHTD